MEKISDKPNYIIPKKPYKEAGAGDPNDDPVEKAFKVDAMRRKIQTSNLIPQQKYAIPQTSNQEIGWDVSPMYTKDRRPHLYNKKKMF